MRFWTWQNAWAPHSSNMMLKSMSEFGRNTTQKRLASLQLRTLKACWLTWQALKTQAASLCSPWASWKSRSAGFTTSLSWRSRSTKTAARCSSMMFCLSLHSAVYTCTSTATVCFTGTCLERVESIIRFSPWTQKLMQKRKKLQRHSHHSKSRTRLARACFWSRSSKTRLLCTTNLFSRWSSAKPCLKRSKSSLRNTKIRMSRIKLTLLRSQILKRRWRKRRCKFWLRFTTTGQSNCSTRGVWGKLNECNRKRANPRRVNLRWANLKNSTPPIKAIVTAKSNFRIQKNNKLYTTRSPQTKAFRKSNAERKQSKGDRGGRRLKWSHDKAFLFSFFSDVSAQRNISKQIISQSKSFYHICLIFWIY